ncbi:MAG: hypothetical protein LKE85_12160 [Lachnospiraceae bacterium]|jgi:hypothetical protein|nr:hypothetical protein [Lachnospiraceae bacterium]
MRNSEGYMDPTATAAMNNVMREYKEKQKAKFRKKYEMTHRKKVYVVSPYAGDVDANIESAKRYCRFVIGKGYMPIASHLLYPRILKDADPAERELGLMFGLSLLALSDEVWVFTANGVSDGMKQEIHEAKRLKKTVRTFGEVK